MKEHLYIALRPKNEEAFVQHENEYFLERVVLGKYYISYLMQDAPDDITLCNFIRLSARMLSNASVSGSGMPTNIKIPILTKELVEQIDMYLRLGIPLSALQETQEWNYETK